MKSDLDRVFEQVLGAHPQARRLHGLVISFIRSLGEVEVVPRKTQVAFKRGRGFAWVWLPQMWIKRQPPSSIALSFALDHRIRDRRIKECVEPYPGRFMHHLVIKQGSDFDAKVKRWLRQAYRLAEGVRAARAGKR